MADAKYRYVGNAEISEHHYQIPARDLTEDDLELLDDEQKKTVRSSKLYVAVKTPRHEGGDS